MSINFMLFASPLFLLLILLEYLYSQYKKRSFYNFNDAINNFCSGILEEVATLPVKSLLLYCYYYVFEHYALLSIGPDSIISWLILWIGVDFCYYWFHRVSHRNSFFWIGHSVHHQSEHYNLSVALRQGCLQTLTSWIFYLPLALIGFPTTMFIILTAVNSIYQFWIHTEIVKKMGWFEKIFNSPSHHRVHHGRNPEYIDKNYAGFLIIWDKLFGTFEEEKNPANYGVTEPLDSWNSFYANVKAIKDIFYYGHSLKNRLNILRAFFMPPEWITQRLAEEKSLKKRKVKSKNSQSPRLYMLFNLIMLIAMYLFFSFTFNKLSFSSWLIGSLIFLTIYLMGTVANGNLNVSFLELFRTIFLITSLLLFTDSQLSAISIGILFFILNYVFLKLERMKPFTASLRNA